MGGNGLEPARRATDTTPANTTETRTPPRNVERVVQQRLVDEFPHVVPTAVKTLIRREHARFETSQIRDFVPLLVEKSARRELKHTPSISPMGVSL
jgi:hypothetical protein